jgi:hypothetical protein
LNGELLRNFPWRANEDGTWEYKLVGFPVTRRFSGTNRLSADECKAILTAFNFGDVKLVGREDPIPPELVTPTTAHHLRRLYHVGQGRGMSHTQCLEYISFRWGARDAEAMMILTALVQELNAEYDGGTAQLQSDFDADLELEHEPEESPSDMTPSESTLGNTTSVASYGTRALGTVRTYTPILPRPAVHVTSETLGSEHDRLPPPIQFSSLSMSSSPLGMISPSLGVAQALLSPPAPIHNQFAPMQPSQYQYMSTQLPWPTARRT